MAIRWDRVEDAGTRKEVESLIGPSTKVIEASGKTLFPGLYDSHVHPTSRLLAWRNPSRML